VKTITVTEGAARLIVPAESSKDPFHQPVFFNPRMEFNRTVSSLAFGAAKGLLEGAAVLDGLCATGPRGIRYLKEAGADKVTFVEANPDATKILKKNLALNKISKGKCKIVEKDLNAALVDSEQRFDFVEIDPFGSPVFYLENAVRRIKKKAVLSVTATDMAGLCGAEKLSCVRKYGAEPLKTEYCHEIAVRLLLGRIAKTAAMLDFSTKPLMSFYQGHAVKVIALLEKNADGANATLKNIGFVNHCFNCLNRTAGNFECECGCGKRFSHAGPLWVGETSDAGFVRSMISELEARGPKSGIRDLRGLRGFLELIIAENALAPGFYETGTVSRKAKKPSPAMEKTLGALRAAGYAAERTHYSPMGFRTSAPAEKVVGLFRTGRLQQARLRTPRRPARLARR